MKIAVVTGANRGLGLGVVESLAKLGYQVVATSRNESSGKKAVENLRSSGLSVEWFKLDVTKEADVVQLINYLVNQYGHVDTLVNNAGVFLDGREPDSETVLNVDFAKIRDTFEINTLGALRTAMLLVPLLKKAKNGRVVNVSSGMGQLTDMAGGYPAYRVSKTALNSVTRMLASELAESNILVNSVCPGWVRTDMGGKEAARSIAEGIDGIVWLASSSELKETGAFWRDRKKIAW